MTAIQEFARRTLADYPSADPEDIEMALAVLEHDRPGSRPSTRLALRQGLLDTIGRAVEESVTAWAAVDGDRDRAREARAASERVDEAVLELERLFAVWIRRPERGVR